MDYRHSLNSSIGLFFTTKHFALNVQAAKNLFQNLGPKGTRINVLEKLSETFFTANVRWFIGEDVNEKIKTIENYQNCYTGETSDVTFHKAYMTTLDDVF